MFNIRLKLTVPTAIAMKSNRKLTKSRSTEEKKTIKNPAKSIHIKKCVLDYIATNMHLYNFILRMLECCREKVNDEIRKRHPFPRECFIRAQLYTLICAWSNATRRPSTSAVTEKMTKALREAQTLRARWL